MSFLDNLENNLKALESRETGGLDHKGRRDTERREAIAAAPWADRLKVSPWTKALMQQATREGFQRRIKVHLIWIGNSTLRLEALGERLELRPVPDGIIAVFLTGIDEISRHPVSLDGEPKALIQEWMTIVDARKRHEAEKARQLAIDEEEAGA